MLLRGEVSGRKIRPAAANDAASEARSPFRGGGMSDGNPEGRDSIFSLARCVA